MRINRTKNNFYFIHKLLIVFYFLDQIRKEYVLMWKYRVKKKFLKQIISPEKYFESHDEITL